MLFNDYKNVKTIVFSELPNQEKKKYFNFLLENEINFTRDENGYYVALVKLLNPAFYGKGGDNNNTQISQFEKSNPLEMEPKPRSSSQANKKGSMSSTYNARNKSPVKGSEKTNFEKTNQNLKAATKNYDQMFSSQYKVFFKTLSPIVGVRGKKLNLYQLKYNIEEIYSIRFIKDTSTLKNQLNRSARNQEIDVKDPFPVFVVEFLSNKYVKKPIIDQHALDLLLSVDHYCKKHSDIQIFSKFLNEEYDTDDLIFFLFVRSCIEKEMKLMFIEKAREEIKIQYQEDRDEIDTDLYLNIKVCLKIANTIFGTEEEVLLNSFMEKVEKNLVSNQKKGRNLIKASTILEITLEDYHQSRKLYGQNQGPNEIASQNSRKNLEKSKLESEERVDNRGDTIRENKNNRESIRESAPMEKFKDENLFDEFEEDNNEYSSGQKKITVNKLSKQDPNQNQNSNKNVTPANSFPKQVPKNDAEKVAFLKNIIFNYIKEKELDIFFEKLMTSYSIYEKDNENIENILITIKDLVSKKLALLISIIFNKDQQNWFVSLKIKEEDSQNMKHYNNLVNLMTQISAYNNIQDIPENLVENFGQSLLSTPELNTQINKPGINKLDID